MEIAARLELARNTRFADLSLPAHVCCDFNNTISIGKLTVMRALHHKRFLGVGLARAGCHERPQEPVCKCIAQPSATTHATSPLIGKNGSLAALRRFPIFDGGGHPARQVQDQILAHSITCIACHCIDAVCLACCMAGAQRMPQERVKLGQHAFVPDAAPVVQLCCRLFIKGKRCRASYQIHEG